MGKKRAMVDFDGVIHSYDKGWCDGSIYGQIIPGSKEAIDKLRDMGYEICIFTTRASEKVNGSKTEQLIKDLKNWLNTNSIYYDNITSEKLDAKFYIDDKGIRFEKDWTKVLEKIRGIENEKK